MAAGLRRRVKSSMNTLPGPNWKQAQRDNETAACRSVGLVIETRPDHISAEEVIRARRLGCTKAQIGFQSSERSRAVAEQARA